MLFRSNGFVFCGNLREVIYQGTLEQWRKIEFTITDWNGFPEDITIKCSDGDEKLYKNSMIIRDNTLFLCHSAAKNINVPDSVTAIASCAFMNNKSLVSVKIPKQVKIIGNSAFCGCESLKQVELPDDIEGLAYRLFGLCDALENINIPKAAKYIGSNTFCCCKKLKEIKLPEGLKK